MFQQMKKRIKNEKGLTLIELLAVIVILAIVAAIAIPAIGNIIENSRIKAVKSDAATIISAANLYYTEKGTGTEFNQGTGTEYVKDSGNFTTYKVDKDLKFTGTAEVGGVKVIIDAAKVSEIKVDSKDPNAPYVLIE